MVSSSVRSPPSPPLKSINNTDFTFIHKGNGNTTENNISRSSTSTSIPSSITINRRPHSDSISSKHSTVHFNLEDEDHPEVRLSPSRSSSKSSLKSPSSSFIPQSNGLLPKSTTNNTYQPIHPSTLHNSTIPSPPKSAPLLPSQNSSSSSIINMKSFPLDSPISTGPNTRPGLAKNRSSQDRRIWSETLPSKDRSSSLLIGNNGKKTSSKVIGGFETSSNEDTSEDDKDETTTDQSIKDTADTSTNTNTGTNTPILENPSTMGIGIAGPSRPRAKTLSGLNIRDRERQSSDASGTSRDRTKRRKDELKPKRKSSKEPIPTPNATRMLSYRSSNASPPKTNSQLPTSRSDSYFNIIQNGSGFGSGHSPRSSRVSTAKSSPFIESTIPLPNGKPQLSNKRSLDMLKEVRSDSAQDTEGSRISKRKGKEKEVPKKSDDLAASLGLGIGGLQDMALNPEQLRNLLSDSDVSSALRLMNSPHVPASRPTNMNEWSNSVFFSPPNTRPTSPGLEQPVHHSPYLVSAPPALTASETHGRERTMSVASSVAPAIHSTWGSSPRQRHSMDSHPSPEMQALNRRRASSKAGIQSEGQGGHIPFTHHLPVPQVDEGSPEQELDDISDGLPAILENDSTLIPSNNITPSDKASQEGKEKEKDKEKEKEKKSRLSNIFHLGKKKTSVETIPHKHDHNLLHKDHRTDKQKEEDKAREKEKYEKDVERRRLEQERRDEELAQERRFRALTQVAAHPTAERRAYTTGAKLRAFYSHVFEGVEDPPKLNPLAVVRWRIKTEEQNEARKRWEQEQNHADFHSNHSEKSGIANHASPHSLSRTNHYGGNIHTSPMSVGSSNKHDLRKSMESNRSVSLGSLRRSNDTSPNKKRKDDKSRFGYEKGWGFTIDDIVSYKNAKGHVNYFIPPRKSHPDVEVLTEDEDGPFIPNSRNNDTMESRKDDQSSLGESSKKSHLHKMGIKTASNTSLMDVEGAIGDGHIPLSRSTSIETGGKASIPAKHRLTHRTHQSLSAVGQTSLTHALKQPFEKLSNVAKKQRNLGPSRDEGETQHIEDPGTHNHKAAMNSSPNIINIHHTPMSNKPSRTTINSSIGRNKETGLFRRHGLNSTPGGGGGSITDEEISKDKEFHLRKLFLKGQKVLSSFDDASYRLYNKRSELSLASSSGGNKNKQDEREKELLALEAALMRESIFRERQVAEAEEIDKNRKRTELEIQARERIRRLENEIYAERVEHLDAARQKLENVTVNISTVDDAIRQYLYQIDFLRDEAAIAANIEIDWSPIDPLRAIYGNIGRVKPIDEDEHRDTLPPLRSFTTSHDSGSDVARRQRTNSMSNRKPRSQSMAIGSTPRRKGSLNASLAPIHSSLNHSMRHRPRRTYLDPSGMERVDPIKQLELILSFSKDRIKDMGHEKENFKSELNEFISRIELMIKQKENVRKWTRDTLERNLVKQSQLNQLIKLEKSNNNLKLNFIILRDNSINIIIQTIGAFLRFWFWCYYQLKGEFWFLIKWLKPSSYWCSKNNKNNNRSKIHEVVDNGLDGTMTPIGEGNDVDNILDDFGSPSKKSKQYQRLSNSTTNSHSNSIHYSDDEERRVPFLVSITALVLAIGFGFYYYGG